MKFNDLLHLKSNHNFTLDTQTFSYPEAHGKKFYVRKREPAETISFQNEKK